MGAKIKSEKMSFSSMPNFRVVGGTRDSTPGQNNTPYLYRSSRPDFLSQDEVVNFQGLGIRCIIDCRSPREYRKANGEHLLDNTYKVFKIKAPMLKFKPGQHVHATVVESLSLRANITDDAKANNPGNTKHYLVDFFKLNYVWAVFNRAPLWFRFFSFMYLIVDLIKGTNYKHFVGAFAKKVLNKDGLAGQYKDMLNHSQGALGACLKLLANPQNVPAMINCAHGKDRTGVLSALVLGCLGRSKEEIAQDYAKSEVELERMKDRLHSEIVEKFDMCKSFTTAKYETMIEVLDYIEDTWGSIPNYLEFIGITLDDQEKLRKNLLNLE